MEKIKFKSTQSATSLNELVLNLDKNLSMDKAFLSKVTYIKKGIFLKTLIFGVVIILLTTLLTKVLEKGIDTGLDSMPFSTQLFVIILTLNAIYLVYLIMRNQRPKSDVVFFFEFLFFAHQ